MMTFTSTPAARARRFAAGLAVASIAALLFSGGAAQAEQMPLKVCADPDNLPFSSSAGRPDGFYLDLADQLAKALGRSPERVWQLTHMGKRAVRSSLLARRCDLFIGLPGEGEFMGRRLIMTKPFAVFRYALVLPEGSRLQSLAELRGQRVAVQFATPPQSLIASLDGVRTVTVLSPEEGMRALAEGRADAAYLWGPSAGYLNLSSYAGRYQVIPTEGDGMAWPIAIAFLPGDSALRDSVQRELDTLGPWLGDVEATYGFPRTAPLRLADAAAGEPIRLAAAGGVGGLYAQADAPAATAPAATAPVATAPEATAPEATAPGATAPEATAPAATAPVATAPASDEAKAERGHTLFNANCSHCHGPDAASPERRTDLRRIRKKYTDTADEVFAATVLNGRPDKGMPPWKDVLPEADIASIKAYVDSVQQPK